MKKHTFVWLLLGVFVSVSGAQDVFALSIGRVFEKSIQPEHRVCEKDTDCTLVAINCECGCQNDINNYDAINKISKNKYDDPCATKEMIEECSMAGACISPKIPTAVCKNSQCAVDWKNNPILHPKVSAH
jgi:hypothetical protein